MGDLVDLRQDLVAAARSQLSNVDRLTEELEAHISDFRRLLERNKKNERSRGLLQQKSSNAQAASVIEIDGTQYEVSDEFRNAALIVADNLDLDELEAAGLCISVQDETTETDQTLAFRAILKFHDHRHNLLDCIRLVLKQSVDDDDSVPEEVVDWFQSIVARITGTAETSGIADRESYWKRCVDGLSEVEAQIKQTQDHVQAALMTGQSLSGEYGELLHSQRMLLTRQHEELASILCYLIRARYITTEGFRAFLSKVAATEATTAILSHFIPVIIAGSAYFGSDSSITDAAALDLHRLFASGPAQLQWKNTALKSAATVCWLVEYTSRFQEHNVNDSKAESLEDRQKLFFESLDQNAFQFLLATADFMEPEVWHDPAKMGLVKFLLDTTTQFGSDAIAVDADFAKLTMQEYQAFAEALVSHMPDVLRQMKDEEDEKRRNLSLEGPNAKGYEMHLERFLLIVAYAYQDDPSAAMDFWGDAESNMYGFLRWTSRRLPTPRVAAFCELLRSLASDEKSATHTHTFLMEDLGSSAPRSRKAHGVGWNQIFSELELYANSVRNRPAAPATGAVGATTDPDIVEAETPIMLEAYLRLTAHIIHMSPTAQNWILREQSFHLHEIVLQLAQSSAPTAVQACCFNVLAALLTGKPTDVSDGLWVALDAWLAGGGGSSRPAQSNTHRAPPEKHYLRQIGADAEVATAFIHLLNALVSPSNNAIDGVDELPFPEQLGSAHRHAGIDTYVDFVLGQAFALLSSDPAAVEDRMQLSVLRHACLTFTHLCLSSFNEDLAVLTNASGSGNGGALKARSFDSYAKLHPFARTMEYMFNDGVINVLLQTAQQHIDELDTLDNDSPLVQATIKAVQIMQLALDKQATYFDVVRPLIKTQSARRPPTVANPAISSFDEVLVLHLDLAVSLARYAICRHSDLVLSSLGLLRSMSQSRKVVGHLDGPAAGRNSDRLVSRLAEWSEALQAELKANFNFSVRVLEFDENPISYVRAAAVLDLLITSLTYSPERPALAHCLLGFECQEHVVEINPNSFFADGKSLFHAITSAAVSLPTSFGLEHTYWLQVVRTGCIKVLAKLVAANLTTDIVSVELRSMEFYPALRETLLPVGNDALWDNFLAQDPNILFKAASLDLRDFVRERESTIDVLTKELLAVTSSGLESSRDRHLSVLLGSKAQIISDGLGQSLAFTLLDFLDLELPVPMDAELKLLHDVDLSQFMMDSTGDDSVFDIKQIKQALLLKKRQLFVSGAIRDTNEEQHVNDEILALLTSLEGRNRHKEIASARLDALESWTDMIVTLLTSTNARIASGAVVAREALFSLLSRLDRAFEEDLDAAAQLSKLALAVVRTLAGGDAVAANTIDNSVERLAKLFLICLRATNNANTGPALRDVCYRICNIIVNIASRPERAASSHQILDIFQDLSERAVRNISEDALSGRGATRVSALLFLDSVLRFATTAKRSEIVLRPLVKLNFVPVLIDSSIGNVSTTFENAGADLTSSLAFFYTAIVLLLAIARAGGDGPQLILNSDFFNAVEDSRLFSTDPDIGLDIDNNEALEEFYKLLAAIVRIIVTIVVMRGSGDGAVIQMARKFLSDNRSSVTAIFKLTTRHNRAAHKAEEAAKQLAIELTNLMLVTGFIEEDEAQAERLGPRTAFS